MTGIAWMAGVAITTHAQYSQSVGPNAAQYPQSAGPNAAVYKRYKCILSPQCSDFKVLIVLEHLLKALATKDIFVTQASTVEL